MGGDIFSIFSLSYSERNGVGKGFDFLDILGVLLRHLGRSRDPAISFGAEPKEYGIGLFFEQPRPAALQ